MQQYLGAKSNVNHGSLHDNVRCTRTMQQSSRTNSQFSIGNDDGSEISHIAWQQFTDKSNCLEKKKYSYVRTIYFS